MTTSVAQCTPRYTRPAPAAVIVTVAAATIAARRRRLAVRATSTSASTPSTTVASTVCPDGSENPASGMSCSAAGGRGRPYPSFNVSPSSVLTSGVPATSNASSRRPRSTSSRPTPQARAPSATMPPPTRSAEAITVPAVARCSTTKVHTALS